MTDLIGFGPREVDRRWGQSLSSVLIGLLGTLVGAAASTVAQVLLSNLARRRQLADSRVGDAAALVASAEGIATEYRMLAYSLDHGERETAKVLFERGLDAWSKFQNARARVDVTCSEELNKASDTLYGALNVWVDNVDLYYFGKGDGADHESQGEHATKQIKALAAVAATEPDRKLSRHRTSERQARLNAKADS